MPDLNSKMKTKGGHHLQKIQVWIMSKLFDDIYHYRFRKDEKP